MAASMEVCLKQINIARNELKNIRQQIATLKRVIEKDVKAINNVVKSRTSKSTVSMETPMETWTQMETQLDTQSGTAHAANQQRSASGLPSLQPIGYLRSCFNSKNGTPRQPSVCSFAKGRLQISKSVFVHPEHSLQGLANFSHVWILFAFHDNGPSTNFTKAKVKPPRLNGDKTGLFSTRSPHRPNPIGLSLAKLDKVQGDTIYLSGIDIIDKTPILDIKPYVPMYDRPDEAFRAGKAPRLDQENEYELELSKCNSLDSSLSTDRQMMSTDESVATANEKKNSTSPHRVGTSLEECTPEETRLEGSEPVRTILESCKPERCEPEGTRLEGCTPDKSIDDVRVPEWITSPPIKELCVRFTPSADRQLEDFMNTQSEGHQVDDHAFEYFSNGQEAKQAITAILVADPRSSYRRKTCRDKLYYFTVDKIHVTAWFGHDFVEVLQIKHKSKT